MNRALNQTGFWYLRHGQTDWNTRNLAQGAVETRLNATGEAQAEAAAQALRDRGIGQIFSSPLLRARQTAEIVGASLDVIPQFVPDLRETSYGVQEGNSMDSWFDQWIDGLYTPDGAESFDQLALRAVRGVNHCLSSGSGPIMIVSHGAFFRGLRRAMGLEPNVRMPNATPVWCDWVDGRWQLTWLTLEGK